MFKVESNYTHHNAFNKAFGHKTSVLSGKGCPPPNLLILLAAYTSADLLPAAKFITFCSAFPGCNC